MSLRTAIYEGNIPTMESGDILGHEFMGEVVETGKEIQNLKKGDRVVVPFTIACGGCFFCKNSIYYQILLFSNTFGVLQNYGLAVFLSFSLLQGLDLTK